MNQSIAGVVHRHHLLGNTNVAAPFKRPRRLVSIPEASKTQSIVRLSRYKIVKKVDISSPPSWTELENTIRQDNHLADTTELHVFRGPIPQFKNMKKLAGDTGTETIFNIMAYPEIFTRTMSAYHE
eukprot:GHVU01194138.1.p2 GENE.GHVU01194138.1~~GHVU01194138.1.p2  ORF type:complete len:126 (-),score=13.46 GHVU01194138.1:509-886(-)